MLVPLCKLTRFFLFVDVAEGYAEGAYAEGAYAEGEYAEGEYYEGGYEEEYYEEGKIKHTCPRYVLRMFFFLRSFTLWNEFLN